MPVEPGDVIQVAEDDYFYGLGCLTLRVTRVHGLLVLADGPWVTVDGIPLWSNGVDGRERYAQIRVAAIRYQPRQAPSNDS
jgi:hypothetical protein